MRRKNSFPFLTHPTNLPKAQTVAWVIYPNHTNPNHLFYPAQEFAAPHFSNQRQTVFQRNSFANIFYYFKKRQKPLSLPSPPVFFFFPPPPNNKQKKGRGGGGVFFFFFFF